MCVFDICIADLTFHITTQYGACKKLCQNYLIDATGEIEITISPTDIENEREYIRADKSVDEGLCDSPAYFIETICLLHKIADAAPSYKRLLMHGSTISVDGKGFVFTAVSGTGKSTHTRLLRQLLGERAVMINDDKPFLRISDDEIYVCGTPWMGKHQLGSNISAPLCGIFFLYRSEQNTLERIEPGDALNLLMVQCHRPNDMETMFCTLDILDCVLNRVPLYRLGCNMDISAAELSSSVM